jgi:hypothetical protein
MSLVVVFDTWWRESGGWCEGWWGVVRESEGWGGWEMVGEEWWVGCER